MDNGAIPYRELILVAEDNDTLRVTLKVRLEKAGYRVLTAINGQEAISLLAKTAPDLVIADIMMPIVDGIGLLHHIKGQQKYRFLPVMMLTSLDQKKHVVSALQAGADDYIVKPFDPNRFTDKIQTLLQRRKNNVTLENLEKGRRINRTP